MLYDDASLRHGKVVQWLPSDTVDRYVAIQPNGKTNYSTTAFNYSFNEHGFRCDSFSTEADVRVLVMGCSLTEGIGLPLDEVWSSFLVNKIKSIPGNTDKKVPLWSLALGGTGIDTGARNLITYIDLIKPTHIIYLTLGMHRREYCFASANTKCWLPSHPTDSTEQVHLDHLNSDAYFSLYQAYRSCHLISLVARANQCKLFMFDLASHDPLGSQVCEMTNINYCPIPYRGLPRGTTFPEELAHLNRRPPLARDSSHPGVLFQYYIFQNIWKVVLKEFYPK